MISSPSIDVLLHMFVLVEVGVMRFVGKGEWVERDRGRWDRERDWSRRRQWRDDTSEVLVDRLSLDEW